MPLFEMLIAGLSDEDQDGYYTCNANISDPLSGPPNKADNERA
jgi:hypothetical protein